MPRRMRPLVNGQYYHVYNRGVNKQPIFMIKRDYKRAIDILSYYLVAGNTLSYSKFTKLSRELRNAYLVKPARLGKYAEIICYCYMPNHFHLLLKQRSNDGISKFMSKYQNSYTRYFNMKNDRIGHLFQGQFKSVRIETDAQLLHVGRYMHLNPFTSHLVGSQKELELYE